AARPGVEEVPEVPVEEGVLREREGRAAALDHLLGRDVDHRGPAFSAAWTTRLRLTGSVSGAAAIDVAAASAINAPPINAGAFAWAMAPPPPRSPARSRSCGARPTRPPPAPSRGRRRGRCAASAGRGAGAGLRDARSNLRRGTTRGPAPPRTRPA